MPPKKKKKTLSVFVHDSKTKEDDKIVLQRVGFEISRELQGLLLQSRKMAKRRQSSWKPVETTAELSLTSLLASGANFLGREAVKWATKTGEVPRHIKIGRRTVVAGEKLQGKPQEAVCCQFFQGSAELLENVSSKSVLGSTWLVRCENENCPSQVTNDFFLVMLSRQQKGSNRAQRLK